MNFTNKTYNNNNSEVGISFKNRTGLAKNENYNNNMRQSEMLRDSIQRQSVFDKFITVLGDKNNNPKIRNKSKKQIHEEEILEEKESMKDYVMKYVKMFFISQSKIKFNLFFIKFIYHLLIYIYIIGPLADLPSFYVLFVGVISYFVVVVVFAQQVYSGYTDSIESPNLVIGSNPGSTC
jgi:hypothetical protein